jgi:hypothetical protein
MKWVGDFGRSQEQIAAEENSTDEFIKRAFGALGQNTPNASTA